MDTFPCLPPTRWSAVYERVCVWCMLDSGGSLCVCVCVPVCQDRHHQSWSSLNGRLAAIKPPWLHRAVPQRKSVWVQRRHGNNTPADTDTVCGMVVLLHRNDSFIYPSRHSQTDAGGDGWRGRPPDRWMDLEIKHRNVMDSGRTR